MMLVILCAYLLDCIIGDPRSIPHPVIYMGKCINWLETRIRLLAIRESQLKVWGILFPLVLVGGSFATVWLLLKGLALISPWLSVAAQIWLISTTLATKGLGDAGIEIYRLLRNNDLANARNALAMVVGRDTHSLDEPEISRAAVETVAENIVDAIISPLFYATIGGAPLAMAYRAANTLDSMVGYKNDKYLNLGWASARFDDLVNYLPARLAAITLVIVSFILRLDWRNAWKVICRDARLHPSPNSGFTEAGVAGALGIQLGGINYYQGVASNRAKLGDAKRAIEAGDIAKTVKMMRLISLAFVAGCVSGLYAIAHYWRA